MAGWAAGIQAAGSIGGAGIAALSQASANRKNIKLQREAWARDDSAYQRTVSDLLAAGLNPMLAVSQGPSNANSAATQVRPVDALGHGVSSAADVVSRKLALEQQKANIDLTRAQAASASAAAQWAPNNEMHRNMILGEEWMTKRFGTSLSEEQLKQYRELMPMVAEAARLANELTKQQTSSAKTHERREAADIPEAEAAARFFESQLGEKVKEGGKLTELGRNLLQLFNAMRGK